MSEVDDSISLPNESLNHSFMCAFDQILQQASCVPGTRDIPEEWSTNATCPCGAYRPKGKADEEPSRQASNCHERCEEKAEKIMNEYSRGFCLCVGETKRDVSE